MRDLFVAQIATRTVDSIICFKVIQSVSGVPKIKKINYKQSVQKSSSRIFWRDLAIQGQINHYIRNIYIPKYLKRN